MEKRITKKFEDHILKFKDEIKSYISNNELEIYGKVNKEEFLKFIFDFNSISLDKNDFAKRKRIKNLVPQIDRCCACRANGEQCTRRKQDGLNFCGTHNKGTPHGTIEALLEDVVPTSSKIEVSIKEINGIHLYVDERKNIYKTEEILQNQLNPTIIGKYTEVNNDCKCHFY